MQAPHPLYKPNKHLVACEDPLCALLHWPGSLRCDTPEEQCDYEVEYADHGSSMGVLVQDIFPLKFTNGSTLGPRIAFGYITFSHSSSKSITNSFTLASYLYSKLTLTLLRFD